MFSFTFRPILLGNRLAYYSCCLAINNTKRRPKTQDSLEPSFLFNSQYNLWPLYFRFFKVVRFQFRLLSF